MDDADRHSNEASVGGQADARVWDEIATQIDALLADLRKTDDGRSAGQPPLRRYLDDFASQHRRLALRELIRADMEYRWSNSLTRHRLLDYLKWFPEIGPASELPADLIFEEVQLRLEAGDEVSIEDVLAQYPDQGAALRMMFGSSAAVAAATERYDGDTSQDAAGKRLDGASGKGKQVASSDAPTVARRRHTDYRSYEEGDSVDDFDLLLELGRGSFARVFLARQRSLERLVALKISSARSSEPQTLAQLEHPNIVRVFDQRFGDDPPVELLYMELVPGGTLRDVVERSRDVASDERDGRIVIDHLDERLAASGSAPPQGSPLRDRLAESTWWEVVCRLGRQLADGLAYAHGKGILHRDIKPANVLLAPEGSPKLADFNISFNSARESERAEDSFGGSFAYMSPEQLEACHPALGGSPQLVRKTSDIYSLGIVLWELLTGERPFNDRPAREGTAAMLQRMVHTRREVDAKALEHQLPSNCPKSLRQVLVKCLAANPQDRFRSAEALAQALQLCLHPRCWKLLHERPSALGRLFVTLPVVCIVLAGFVPNFVAAIFNLQYNRNTVVNRLGNVADTFEPIQWTINGIVFPLGIAVTSWMVARATRSLRSPASRVGEDQRELLFLGHRIALVVFALWLLSGIAFPLTLHWRLRDAFPMAAYAEFFGSLLLCGAMAVSYNFLLTTFVAVRWLLPAQMRRSQQLAPSQGELDRVATASRVCLAAAAAVPMLAIFVALMYETTRDRGPTATLAAPLAADANSASDGTDLNDRQSSPGEPTGLATDGDEIDIGWALISMSLAGFAGLCFIFPLERQIEQDLDALSLLSPEMGLRPPTD